MSRFHVDPGHRVILVSTFCIHLHVETVFEIVGAATEIVVVVLAAEARLDSGFVAIINVKQNNNVRILKSIMNDLCFYNFDKEKKKG